MTKSQNMNIDTGEKTWLTPPHIIEALGPFDLDPCCPPNMPWRTATRMVCRPDDGLAVDWTGKRVWLNPPYGREAVPFLRKMAQSKTGGVSPCSSDERTLSHGTNGFFHLLTVFSSFADASSFTFPTERVRKRLLRPLRSSRIPNGILPVSARAGLQGRF